MKSEFSDWFSLHQNVCFWSRSICTVMGISAPAAAAAMTCLSDYNKLIYWGHCVSQHEIDQNVREKKGGGVGGCSSSRQQAARSRQWTLFLCVTIWISEVTVMHGHWRGVWQQQTHFVFAATAGTAGVLDDIGLISFCVRQMRNTAVTILMLADDATRQWQLVLM